MSELWRPVPDWPDYEVSNLGRVRSIDRTVAYIDQWGRPNKQFIKGRILALRLKDKTYFTVSLHKGLKTHTRFVHRLVVEAFIGPIPKGMCVLHGPNGSLDNRASELRIGTHKQNSADKFRDGTAKWGAEIPTAKLTDDDIPAIRADTRSSSAIAADYGVTRQNIDFIKRRITWKHVS